MRYRGRHMVFPEEMDSPTSVSAAPAGDAGGIRWRLTSSEYSPSLLAGFFHFTPRWGRRGRESTRRDKIKITTSPFFTTAPTTVRNTP